MVVFDGQKGCKVFQFNLLENWTKLREILVWIFYVPGSLRLGKPMFGGAYVAYILFSA
jgi:hypothetical protein